MGRGASSTVSSAAARADKRTLKPAEPIQSRHQRELLKLFSDGRTMSIDLTFKTALDKLYGIDHQWNSSKLSRAEYDAQANAHTQIREILDACLERGLLKSKTSSSFSRSYSLSALGKKALKYSRKVPKHSADDVAFLLSNAPEFSFDHESKCDCDPYSEPSHYYNCESRFDSGAEVQQRAMNHWIQDVINPENLAEPEQKLPRIDCYL